MPAKVAAAAVKPVRQRTQYSCMSASMAMCLNALEHTVTEDEVNRVMGAKPMKGAAWEEALACSQHYGCRATLTMPATVSQLKAWTDAGVPVMIAWNPEGREWSHASVVFDVQDNPAPVGRIIFVADPNIPNPEKTVREVPEDEFYGKWYEKWPNYLVRRPACAIEREVTVAGRQVVAHGPVRGGVPDDVRAFLGLPPYSNDAMNFSYQDGYAWVELKRRYDVETKDELIRKFKIRRGDLPTGFRMASEPAATREEMIEKYARLSRHVREYLGIPPQDEGGNTGWGDSFFWNAHIRGRYKVKDEAELLKKLDIDPRDLRRCCSKWRPGRRGMAQRVAGAWLSRGAVFGYPVDRTPPSFRIPSYWKEVLGRNGLRAWKWADGGTGLQFRLEEHDDGDPSDVISRGFLYGLLVEDPEGQVWVAKGRAKHFGTMDQWATDTVAWWKKGPPASMADVFPRKDRYLKTHRRLGGALGGPVPTDLKESVIALWGRVRRDIAVEVHRDVLRDLHGEVRGGSLYAQSVFKYRQVLLDIIKEGDRKSSALATKALQSIERAPTHRSAKKKKTPKVPKHRIGPQLVTKVKRRPGAGPHKNRNRDVETGRSRKPKHKNQDSAARVAGRYLKGDV
jgi:hypothetical protein